MCSVIVTIAVTHGILLANIADGYCGHVLRVDKGDLLLALKYELIVLR